MDSPIAAQRMRDLVWDMVPSVISHVQGVIIAEGEFKKLERQLKVARDNLDNRTEDMVRFFDAFVEIAEYSPLLDDLPSYDDVSYQRFIAKFKIEVTSDNSVAVSRFYQAIHSRLYDEDITEDTNNA